LALMHGASAIGCIIPLGPVLLPYILHHFTREQWGNRNVEITATKLNILNFQLPFSLLGIFLMIWAPSYMMSLPYEAVGSSMVLTLVPILTSLLNMIQFCVPLYAVFRVLSGYKYKYPTLIPTKKITLP